MRDSYALQNQPAPFSLPIPGTALSWLRDAAAETIAQSGNSLVEMAAWLLTPANGLNRFGSQSASEGAAIRGGRGTILGLSRRMGVFSDDNVWYAMEERGGSMTKGMCSRRLLAVLELPP